MNENEYMPRRVSHPGETLRDVMVERGLTTDHLAALSPWPADLWQRVIDGKTRMSYDMAGWLDEMMGTDRFWVRRVRDHYVASLINQKGE